jgi:hypothetical protein
MPPLLTYAVNFNNGNLHPHVNLNGWPDMQFSPELAGVAEHSVDPYGLTMTFTRTASPPAGAPTESAVYLPPPRFSVPPHSYPLDTRLFMSVKFDLPKAELIPGADTLPQPWAVALVVKGGGGSGDQEVYVTCQFRNDPSQPQLNGVRLNTPKDPTTGIGALQNDKGLPLDSPLDYSNYGESWLWGPRASFRLEHAFCGFDSALNKHVPGSGALTIVSLFGLLSREDRRVYSSNALSSGGSDSSFIQALKISVTTRNGIGRISARLRQFALSFNQSV